MKVEEIQTDKWIDRQGCMNETNKSSQNSCPSDVQVENDRFRLCHVLRLENMSSMKYTNHSHINESKM